MSSTGTIGKVVGAPATKSQETNRSNDQTAMGSPGITDGLRQVSGVITEVYGETFEPGVDEEAKKGAKPLIKAATTDGYIIANGKWIPLNHSRLEVVEKIGKLRQGLVVQVFYSGPAGGGANATLIGLENEPEGEGTQIVNDIDEPLWEIFTPGSTAV